MDWIGLLVDEELGGVGWRPVEACVIAEELGRAADPSPWFGSAMAAAALSDAPDEIRDRWLPEVLSGVTIAVSRRPTMSFGSCGGDKASRRHHRRPQRSSPDRACRRDSVAGPIPIRWTSHAPVWCVDISGCAGCADRVARHRPTDCIAVARLLVSADASGALSSDAGPAHGVSQGAHRVRRADRQFPSGATPVGRAAGVRSQGARNRDEGGAHAGVADIADEVAGEMRSRSRRWRTPSSAPRRPRPSTSACNCPAVSDSPGSIRCTTNCAGLQRMPLLLGTARSSRALFAEVSGW